jgi:amidohydrolase
VPFAGGTPVERQHGGSIGSFSLAESQLVFSRSSLTAPPDLWSTKLVGPSANHTQLTRESVPALERVVGKQKVTLIPPAMGSEDFSFFANEVPGFFYRLGQVKAGTTSGDHHTPTFLADDGSIPVGVKAMSFLIFDYLSRHK